MNSSRTILRRCLIDFSAVEGDSVAIFVREDRFVRQRPFDADGWVVPEQRAFVFGEIIVGTFIAEIGRLAEYAEAVSTSWWDKDLAAGLVAQFNAERAA